MFCRYIPMLKVPLQISCRPPLHPGKCHMISPEPSFVHADQPHLSQLFCKTEVLYPSGHLPVLPWTHSTRSMSLLWTHSIRSVYLLCWVSQSFTQRSKGTSRKQRRILFLALITTLLLMQPRRQLAVWDESSHY